MKQNYFQFLSLTPLSRQPHETAQGMGRGRGAITPLHGLQCLMHMLLGYEPEERRAGPLMLPVIGQMQDIEPPEEASYSVVRLSCV